MLTGLDSLGTQRFSSQTRFDDLIPPELIDSARHQFTKLAVAQFALLGHSGNEADPDGSFAVADLRTEFQTR